MSRQLELTVQGSLGTTPVVSRTASDRAYCHFRVATTPTFRGSDGVWRNGETVWFTAKAWGALAENLGRSLRKGDPVILVGRFTQETWSSKVMGDMLSNVLTVSAGGHDLTRGESRFMKVERGPADAAAQAPVSDSSAQSPEQPQQSQGPGDEGSGCPGRSDREADFGSGSTDPDDAGPGLSDSHWYAEFASPANDSTVGPVPGSAAAASPVVGARPQGDAAGMDCDVYEVLAP